MAETICNCTIWDQTASHTQTHTQEIKNTSQTKPSCARSTLLTLEKQTLNEELGLPRKNEYKNIRFMHSFYTKNEIVFALSVLVKYFFKMILRCPV